MQIYRARASRWSFTAAVLAAGGLAAQACGGSSGTEVNGAAPSDAGVRGIDPAGQACTTPTQCYADLRSDGGAAGDASGDAMASAVVGNVTCLTKVTNGYCTHTCVQDSDCCAVPGECRSGVKQVCSPLENQGDQYCFLSCEDDDMRRALAATVDAGGAPDAGASADEYCRVYAGAATSCRSSGGGSKNRKVCIPKF